MNAFMLQLAVPTDEPASQQRQQQNRDLLMEITHHRKTAIDSTDQNPCRPLIGAQVLPVFYHFMTIPPANA